MPQTANLMELRGGGSSPGGRISSLTFSGEAGGSPGDAKEGRAEIRLATETFRRKSRRGIEKSGMRVLVIADLEAESQRENWKQVSREIREGPGSAAPPR